MDASDFLASFLALTGENCLRKKSVKRPKKSVESYGQWGLGRRAIARKEYRPLDVYATGVEIPCCGDLVSCAIANPPGWDYPTRYECHVSCP